MANNINTRREMRSAGYKFLNASTCKTCKAQIEWWLTNNGRKIPLDPIVSDTEQTVPHRATCGDPEGYHNTPSAPKTAATFVEADAIRATVDLRTRFNAIAVILIHENGGAFDFRQGVDAEELRNDVIAAGNHMRSHIRKAVR